MYKKLKKQKGEKFAQTIRNHHNGILEIPDLDIILRHAGNDAEPLLPYLMSLLTPNDDVSISAPGDPFVLLDEAGYKAFHADTLEKQNSIEHYFAPGELLCTFNDHARYENYHIVHAVKNDADQINRRDFDGMEERQDGYGTSVISIQMLKTGGFISIKNRYNHAVEACDNTFNSNPDDIIRGLSATLQEHFNVEFSTAQSALPNGFVLIGNRIFKYHTEHNNTYYGDQAWAEKGAIHTVDKSAGDALFERVLFDNKTRMLKKIDPVDDDSFADDFNRCYGGNRALTVQSGNLTLHGAVLIGAEQSRIKTLNLPALTEMGDMCLSQAKALTHFEAPGLITMGGACLNHSNALTEFKVPALTTMGFGCLYFANALINFEAPALNTMGDRCLYNATALKHFNAPALTSMGFECLYYAHALTHFDLPALNTMGNGCLCEAGALTHFKAPVLIAMGDCCLRKANALTQFEAPLLTAMGHNCVESAESLMNFKAPILAVTGDGCLANSRNLRSRFPGAAIGPYVSLS